MKGVVTRGSLLSSVPLLAGVPETALDDLVDGAEVRRWPAGARLVSELEPGDEALIVLDGEGIVTVGGLGDEPPVEIGRVASGDCVGEMALFTGELRSATVTAKTPMVALVLDRSRFRGLMARHPAIAARFAATLGARLRDAERLLAGILDPRIGDAERREALARSDVGHGTPRGRSLRTALEILWREAIASHKNELPFLMFVAFVGALLAVRGLIALERAFVPHWMALEAILRASYVSGLLLLCGSGLASLLLFRPRARRHLAVLFGVGMALLFNSLSVLLTFDIYYKDIFTPDPNLRFSIEELYNRSEGTIVVTLTVALLAQAVWLRGFYRRTLTLLALRAMRRLGRA